MTAADLDPAVTAILADDWGDRRAWFTFALGHDDCQPIVADVDGRVVGTAVTTVNGPVAWIGTIWVDPGWRRRGLGRMLTEATMAAADAAGCRTQVLVATDEGRPVYERLGFEVRAWYLTVEAAGRGLETAQAREGVKLRPFVDTDLPAMATLDRAATGEDRSSVLAAMATAGSTRVAVVGDAVRGFVIRAPWGGGATIAPDRSVGLAMLEARRDTYPADRNVRAGILVEPGAPLPDDLAAAGWTEAWRAPRLERGEPLDRRPGAIWGQFNHAMG